MSATAITSNGSPDTAKFSSEKPLWSHRLLQPELHMGLSALDTVGVSQIFLKNVLR